MTKTVRSGHSLPCFYSLLFTDYSLDACLTYSGRVVFFKPTPTRSRPCACAAKGDAIVRVRCAHRKKTHPAYCKFVLHHHTQPHTRSWALGEQFVASVLKPLKVKTLGRHARVGGRNSTSERPPHKKSMPNGKAGRSQPRPPLTCHVPPAAAPLAHSRSRAELGRLYRSSAAQATHLRWRCS